ncbi:MAG: hypothetical protein QNJ97_29395 [Myxococcota bacterium]|nr:hypothetical protein [Myxococcota bacterium]
MKKIVERIAAERPDAFFYWLVPEWATQEDLDWLPKERVRQYVYPYSKDRMKEYQRMTLDLEEAVSFQGALWDVDIMLTNRTTVIPLIKQWMNRPNKVNYNWAKRVILIDDMPLMSFKQLLPSIKAATQDITNLTGYLCADRTYISAFWEKDEILRIGKELLSPSYLRKLAHGIVEASSAVFPEPQLKTRASIERMLNGERQFTIGYCNRLTQSQTRLTEIFDLMEKNRIIRQNVRCLISTVSKTSGRVRYRGKQQLPDWVEMIRPEREGFWDVCRNEFDVVLDLTVEADFSMSLVEPLLLGCPVILIDDKWSRGCVGDDYPFFVKNPKHAFGLLRTFYMEYGKCYREFAQWQQTHFKRLTESWKDGYLPDLIMGEVQQWESLAEDYFRWKNERSTVPISGGVITKHLIEYADKTGEIVLQDALTDLGQQEVIEHLHQKFDPEFKEHLRMAFATGWNEFRLGLMQAGYRDASTQTGHMRKIT